MKELYSIDLKDLQSVSVTCKQCGVKMTVSIEDLIKLPFLPCGICKDQTGETILLGKGTDKTPTNPLKDFVTSLAALQAEGWKVEFEIEHPLNKVAQ